MKSFIGTRTPYTIKGSFPLRFDAIQQAHDAMRAAGLTPYNMLWHFELNPPTDWAIQNGESKANWATTMTAFWDDQTYALPPVMEAELRRWAGHPIMLHHVASHIADSPNRLRINGAGLDQSRFADEAARFYPAAERYFRERGIEPYIMIDEPNIAIRQSGDWYEALPIEEQPDSVRRIARLTEIVRAHSDMRIGPCLTSGWKWKFWRQLGVDFNWWVFIDDARTYERGAQWLPEYRAALGEAETWVYWVDTPWMDGDEADLRRSVGDARANGHDGALFWTGLRTDGGREALVDEAGLNARATLLAELLRAPEPEPEQEPIVDNGIYQIILSNVQEHFMAANGLTAIPGWAERAEIQIEFISTETDSIGARYAPVGSPGDWLGSEGVETWFYVNGVAPEQLATQTAVVKEKPSISDPFWFRKRQANAILGNDWLLKDTAGGDVIGDGRKRPVPDIGNPFYVDWLASEIIKTGVKRVRFDDFNVHQHAFHRPHKANGQNGSDSRFLLGMMQLCQRVRDAGIRVIANGGWEMRSPEAAQWTYPLMDYLDGVVIELTHDAKTGKVSTGFAKWSDGKFWTLTAVAETTDFADGVDRNQGPLWRVVNDWVKAGKIVIIDVVYKGGVIPYEDFVRLWYERATAAGAWFSTARNVRHQVDRFPLPEYEEEEEEEEENEDGGGGAAILAELRAARLDLAAAMAVLERAKERIAVAERLAVNL